MKKLAITLIASAAMTSSILFADSTHANKHDEILHSMHQGMHEGVSMSCNVNIDFLTDMIAHHQGAIDSATLYLDESKNDILGEIAQQIIDTQSDEVAYFGKLLERLDKEKRDCDSESYKAFQDKTQMDLESMLQAMGSVKPSGDIDTDFALAMIAHHKGAIASANTILKYTDNAEIKDIANSIIQTQSDEIEQMQKAIKSNP